MLKVTLEGVGREFGDRRVLSDISIEISGGERILVRGPNGSGKTTLLKILAGLLEPTRGKVAFRRGEDAPTPAERRRLTGYAAPALALYDEFSPLENLLFFARMRGLPKDKEREKRLLDRVGLGARKDDPLGTLSTGMRQRAKLAFALQAEPALLLLDEPSSNLDDSGRTLVRQIVEEAVSRGAAVVVASNDPAEFSLGTRVLELV
jgi:heme exporter protein A